MKFSFLKQSYLLFILAIGTTCIQLSCTNKDKNLSSQSDSDKTSPAKFVSDIIPSLDKWKIMLGDGSTFDDLNQFEHKDFFYAQNESNSDWAVFKTPNAGTTSKNSSNTRSELHQKEEWTPQTGGKLKSTVKVMHVSTTGDARVAAAYTVVIGQIHGGEGHENEPLKIMYKKFPGHKKGSIFWNYEINTKGENSGRWDFSSAVWGYDMSVVGSGPMDYPEEPKDGIELGEEIEYEVNVHQGIMFLTFNRKGHSSKTFTKNLVSSEYSKESDIPQQTRNLFVPIGQGGTEKVEAYKGELMYFKLGCYNQSNGKDPSKNMVWCPGSEVYNGDIAKQYENGSYAEVWFKNSIVGPSSPPKF